MLFADKIKFTITTLALSAALSTQVAQAAVVDLVKNGSLTGKISNGVDSDPSSSLPSDWFVGTNTATLANSPDTMDINNNVGKTGLTNFAATPSYSPDGGTWVGVARDQDRLNENFFQVISGLTIGKQYTLSWYDANFGISSTLSPSIFEPYTGANSFRATFSSLSNTTSFTGISRVLGTNWLQHSFIFTPQNTSYTLSFSLANNTKSYLSIDGISLTTEVTAIPEPSTWAFLILGLLMMSLEVRRRTVVKVN